MATALSQLQDLRHGIDDGIAVDIPEWASNLLLSSMELSQTSLSDHGGLMLHPIWGFWEVKVGRMLSFVVIFGNLNLQTSRRFRWIYLDGTTGPGTGELCPLALALNPKGLWVFSKGRDHPLVIICVLKIFIWCFIRVTIPAYLDSWFRRT